MSPRESDPARWSPDAPTMTQAPMGAVTRCVMVQRWSDVVFCHWRMEPTAVQRLLPGGIEVDTFDGSAWVGLIPFQMQDLGIPRWAPMPYIGSFPEVNVRTYVRAGDRRGVWFLSLDIDRWLPAVVARVGYRIPYCVGDVRHVRVGDRVLSHVDRRWPRAEGATASLSVRIGDPAPDDELTRFLTARWGLVARPLRGRPIWAPVDHPPWVVHHATANILDTGVLTAAGLPTPEGEPHVLFSPGVPVRIGAPRRLDPYIW